MTGEITFVNILYVKSLFKRWQNNYVRFCEGSLYDLRAQNMSKWVNARRKLAKGKSGSPHDNVYLIYIYVVICTRFVTSCMESLFAQFPHRF